VLVHLAAPLVVANYYVLVQPWCQPKKLGASSEGFFTEVPTKPIMRISHMTSSVPPYKVLSRYIVIYCVVTAGRRDEGGEMYGRGMMGYAGGRRTMVPYGMPFPPRFMMGLVIGGLFLLFMAGPAFHFFPLLFLLIWAVPFLVAPAFVAVARGLTGLTEARAPKGGAVTEESKERELLEALARRGELSPALAALETSLTVAEANRMLSDLASSGHVEVRAHEGRLGYALWERDRRELTDGA
jgi:hypothetical protein